MKFNNKIEKKMINFYSKSYSCILGSYSEFNFSKALRNRNFKSFISNNLNKDQKCVFNLRLNKYKEDISQIQKLSFLINYIKKNHFNTINIADIGCGNGQAILHLEENFKDISFIKKIFIDKEINSQLKSKDKSSIIFSKNLTTNLVPDYSLDIILFIHSLHHMSDLECENSIQWCKHKLKDDGIVFVVEDSWDNETIYYNEMDSWFISLNDKEKKEVYRVNEYYSNSWFYGYPFSLETLNHLEEKEWISKFNKKHFKLKEKKSTGFIYNRLHGVPSSSMILKKSL